MPPFQLVFADPPYGKGLGEKALFAAHAGGWLAPGAIAILEERADAQVIVDPVFKFIENAASATKMCSFSYRPADTSSRESPPPDENALTVAAARAAGGRRRSVWRSRRRGAGRAVR
jgi:hypothetical protein